MQRNSRRPNVLCWRMLPAPLLFRTKIFRRLVLWGCHHGDIGRRSQCTCSKIGNLRNKHARSITLLLDVQQNIIRFQITVDQNRGKMFHAVKHALHDIECAVTSLADRNDAIFNSFIQVLAKIAYRSAAEVRHHDGEATVDRARTQRMRNVLCCRVGGERIKCRFLDHEVLHLNLREFCPVGQRHLVQRAALAAHVAEVGAAGLPAHQFPFEQRDRQAMLAQEERRGGAHQAAAEHQHIGVVRGRRRCCGCRAAHACTSRVFIIRGLTGACERRRPT